MLRSVILVGVIALVFSADIEKRDVQNDCYRCSRWDNVGNGYMPSDIPGQCNVYRQCYKSQGAPITGPIYRFCAPGTYTDFFDAKNGNPCTKTTCDPAVCDCTSVEQTSVAMILDCPYIQGSPPWIIKRVGEDGSIVHYGSCGVGGYFNDSYGICSCTEVGVGCSCRVNIPLDNANYINDISCHKAWVAQAGMPAEVVIVQDGPTGVSGSSGMFMGYRDGNKNGAHLTTYTIDGAFAGEYVFDLTFVAWFKLDTTYSGQKWGVLTMGDCSDGPSFAIWVDNYKVQGHIELMAGNNIVKHVIESNTFINDDTWYFVSVVYDSNAVNGDSLKLYVFTAQEYATCRQNPFDPILCPQATLPLSLTGAVSPRGCGLTIGHTASDDETEMFKGFIGQVKVNLSSDNLLACV